MTHCFSTDLPENLGLSSERLSRAAGLIDRFVSENRVVGGTALVCRHGKIAHFSTHGYQNREESIPMAEDSIFRVYSMTKVITSVAIMQLFEQGRVGIEQEVREILPCFNNVRIHETPGDPSSPLIEPNRAPTIYDLLRHMSGLGYEPHPLPLETDPSVSSLTDLIEKACDIPLHAQPGTRWIYSIATDVLGHIIEVISGKTLDRYLKDHIFTPLGMVDTGFWVPDDKAHRLCTMYGDDEENNSIRPIDTSAATSPWRSRPTILSGGGGLVSTTMDILRFCQCLLNKGSLGETRILGRKTVELMCTDHLPPEHPAIEFTGKNLRFGLGVSVIRSLQESMCIGSVGEFGWGGAAGTMEWIDPAEDMVTLLMIQHRGQRAKELEHRFKAAIYSSLT